MVEKVRSQDIVRLYREHQRVFRSGAMGHQEDYQRAIVLRKELDEGLWVSAKTFDSLADELEEIKRELVGLKETRGVFEFKKPSDKELTRHLEKICLQEKVKGVSVEAKPIFFSVKNTLAQNVVLTTDSIEGKLVFCALEIVKRFAASFANKNEIMLRLPDLEKECLAHGWVISQRDFKKTLAGLVRKGLFLKVRNYRDNYRLPGKVDIQSVSV